MSSVHRGEPLWVASLVHRLSGLALVVFLPALLTPAFLLMYQSRYDRSGDLWWFLAWYIVSRLCELMDREIYDWLIVISGHSLKHIATCVGCFVFLRHLHLRRKLKT